MTQTVLKHTVKQGERWDHLAYYYYGDALEYARIIRANPHISFCEVLPTGARVYPCSQCKADPKRKPAAVVKRK